MVQPLALTLGEPAGIGPDLALAIWRRRAEFDTPPFYIVADPDFLGRRAGRLGLDVPIAVVTPKLAATTFRSALPVRPLDVTVNAQPGRPDQSSAPAAVASIRHAVADVMAGAAGGLLPQPGPTTPRSHRGFVRRGPT